MMDSIDLQADGTLHERDDGGSEMQYNFSVVQKGPIAELLRAVVAMTAEQRARLVLDVPGGRSLSVGEMLALAAQEGLA